MFVSFIVVCKFSWYSSVDITSPSEDTSYYTQYTVNIRLPYHEVCKATHLILLPLSESQIITEVKKRLSGTRHIPTFRYTNPIFRAPIYFLHVPFGPNTSQNHLHTSKPFGSTTFGSAKSLAVPQHHTMYFTARRFAPALHSVPPSRFYV